VRHEEKFFADPNYVIEENAPEKSFEVGMNESVENLSI
jgi:hypothetical protein